MGEEPALPTCGRCLTRQQIERLTRKKLVGEGTLLLPATDSPPPVTTCVHPCVPTVYAFVENLVRRLTRRLGGVEDASTQVVAALRRMLVNYTRQSLTQALDGGNDFSSTEMQIAYIFKYMLSHCNIVRRSMSFCGNAFPAPELSHALTQSKIMRAVLIGGGPGSEFLGLLGFLRDCNLMRCAVDACIVDVCTEWFEIQKEAESSARKSGWRRVYVTSLHQNVLEPPSTDLRGRVRECDIITFIKVVSSLSASRNCEKALVNLLKTTPIGCILLYVDNCAATLSKVMHDAAKKCGYALVHMHSGEYPTIPAEERPLLERHLGPLMKEWNEPVQTVTPVRVMIFRKVIDDPGLLCKDMDALPFAVLKKRKAAEVYPHPLARAVKEEENATSEPRKKPKLSREGSGCSIGMENDENPRSSDETPSLLANRNISGAPPSGNATSRIFENCSHGRLEPYCTDDGINPPMQSPRASQGESLELEEGEIISTSCQNEAEQDTCQSLPSRNENGNPGTIMRNGRNGAVDGGDNENTSKSYTVTESRKGGIVVKRFSGGCEIAGKSEGGSVTSPSSGQPRNEVRTEDRLGRFGAGWIGEPWGAICVSMGSGAEERKLWRGVAVKAESRGEGG